MSLRSGELAQFFRDWAENLSGGAVLVALENCERSDSSPRLLELIAGLRQGLVDGVPMTSIFRQFGDLLPNSLVDELELDDKTEELDRYFRELARRLSPS